MAIVQRRCGCTGQRVCLVCAPGSCEETNITERTFLQCCKCGKVDTSEHFVQAEEECCAVLSSCKTPCLPAPVLDARVGTACGKCGEFSGVCVHKDFVTNDAEKQIWENIEKSPWALSQSGRMKQVNTVCVCPFACVWCVTLCCHHLTSLPYRTLDQKLTSRRGK